MAELSWAVIIGGVRRGTEDVYIQPRCGRKAGKRWKGSGSILPLLRRTNQGSPGTRWWSVQQGGQK